MVAQKTAERVELRRRAVQGDHPRRCRPAERRNHAEPVMRLGQQCGVAAGKTGPHFAVFAGAGAGGDVIENDARGFAGLARPVGVARGDEVGLAAQDHAVVEHLEAVGGERRAGGGDVDDHLGGADRRRAFGGAGAFDDAVIDDAVRRQRTPASG